MTCRTGCRISEKFWSMKLVLWSQGETLRQRIETLPVLLTNYQWSREQQWNQVGASIVCTRTFPKNPNCDICMKSKTTEASCRRRAGTVLPRAEKFWWHDNCRSQVCAESESRNNHRHVVVVQDLAPQWLQSYPCKTKTSQETQKSLMKFLEPTRKPSVIYADDSLGFGKSCEDLSWNHCTSTPHRSETTGIAERAVRKVKEGTSAELLQPGLDNEWCEIFKISCLMGNHPIKRRSGIPFNGPVKTFGAVVEYHPISAKDVSRLHQLGPKVLPSKFLSYVLHAGGIWKGDITVADIEELEDMDASEIHARRLNAKEVSTPMKGEKSTFPAEDGTVKNFWRRSTSQTIHLNPGSTRTRRGTRSSSRRIRRALFSNPTSRWLCTGWCGS